MLTRPERLGTQARPPMRRRGAAFPLLALAAVAAGLALGLASAWEVVRRDDLVGRVRAGAWTFSPRVGSREIDPYARAIVSRRGDMPLGVGEGIALRALEDDDGRPLDVACTYRIGRSVPPTRAWTLTVHGRDDARADERRFLTSAGILRGADGGFEIALSRDVMPGNWLRLPASGPALLVLRLYDTPVASGTAALDRNAVPRIARQGCAP